MIRTVARVEIDRSVDDVFEHTTNNIAEWSIMVVRDEPIAIRPDIGVGSKCVCHRGVWSAVGTLHERLQSTNHRNCLLLT